MRILVAPKDEAEYHTWGDITSPAAVIRKQCQLYKSELYLEAFDGNIGAGADYPVVILRILEIGGLILLGVPAMHKKIRETLSEWCKIKKNIDKFIAWLSPQRRVYAYSIEIALLTALEHLSRTLNVEELELVKADEILGVSGNLEPSFENSELVYFEFHFLEPGARRHIVILDWHLNVLHTLVLPLHPAMRS